MILKYSCLLLLKGELCWLHRNYILILNFLFELSNFGHLYLLCDLFEILNSTNNWFETNERGKTIILFDIRTLQCN